MFVLSEAGTLLNFQGSKKFLELDESPQIQVNNIQIIEIHNFICIYLDIRTLNLCYALMALATMD